MEKETRINGYRCNFINNTEEPECNFLCIPIVHDAKYVNIWATISFTPEEKETFGKRIHLLGSRIMPTDVPGQSLSVFVFTYMENDDVEFIKRNANFFFKEGKPAKNEVSDDDAKFAIIESVGPNIFGIVKTIKIMTGMTLSAAKSLVDAVRDGFNQKLELSHLPIIEKRLLLNELRKHNVKFTLK